MKSIHLRQTLPQVFADRNSITSDIWHKNVVFSKGEMYLIEPENHRYAVIFTVTGTTTRGSLISMKQISKHIQWSNGSTSESTR